MDQDHVTIETPEHVNISYELAGVGSRLMACLLDHLIIALAISAALLLAVALKVSLPNMRAPAVIIAVVFGGPLLLMVTYFGAFESLWRGQSPGKRAAGIRVMRDDGTPVSTLDVIIRNAVRILDFLPPFYLIGGVVAFAHGQSKRLGDIAAGTVVVKLRGRELPQVIEEPAADTAPPEELVHFLGPAARTISPEELDTVRRFLDRRFELSPEVRREMSARILAAVRPKLSLDASAMAQTNPEAVLEAISRLDVGSGTRL